jgi:alkylhydroperoxidase family enzyme
MAGALMGAHRTETRVIKYCLLARRVTRYDRLVERLREAAGPDRQAPRDFAPYLDKVRRNAYKVTDEDIQALKDAGYSEDVIFEQTVSVAVAAGLERLNAGLEVLP